MTKKLLLTFTFLMIPHLIFSDDLQEIIVLEKKITSLNGWTDNQSISSVDKEQHVLRLRFGLDGNERHTLAEIGRLLEVSRERVRQVELKALRKLRNLTRKLPSGI